MNSSPASSRTSSPFLSAYPSARAAGRTLLTLALVATAALASIPAQALTPLADQPLSSTISAPGNLALLMSVEFPTAISVAHTSRTYLPAKEYLGFFDPDKCYLYARDVDATSLGNYFRPVGSAAAHTCTSAWSGNFLNWAAMQTIDPFRWVLTGGYRVVDTLADTVIEKAWGTNQGSAGGNFPDSTLSGADIAGATPFPASTGTLSMRIHGLGNKMRFSTPKKGAAVSFAGRYYNNQTRSGATALQRNDASINFNWDTAAPGPGVNRTDMSVRWIGAATAESAGSYTFRVRADDLVKVIVNGSTVINQTAYDNLNNKDSAPITAAAGGLFNIEVQFSQGGGGSSVVLEWLTPGSTTFVAVGEGFSGPAALTGATATHYSEPTVAGTTPGGVAYEVFVRAKVCDPLTASAGPLEKNCVKYGVNYKPEGLMQKYSKKIRYSAFGYLNDDNILRDGGVLRAQQKFIGPEAPVAGAVATTNPATEWNSVTGIFTLNPDTVDAAATAGIMGLPTGSEVTNSGVMNYVNKFGELTPGKYKTYDNVSELYYAAVRYFKNLPHVPEWTAVPAGTSNATRVTWTDGFPVITAPREPLLYSCQRNFILGIGDVNTHADKGLPGRTLTGNEPALPKAVSDDASVNAVTSTNKVGVLQGIAGLGSKLNYPDCCSDNSPGMAGLAYDSHINDIRPDDTAPSKKFTLGKQTIDTFWVDVEEGQVFKRDNQFYLAAKYGGFTVPKDYNPANTTPLPLSSWSTTGDVSTTSGGFSQPRPDNYFSGGKPDLMKAGLDAAFSKISAALGAFTTSFSTSLPQIVDLGNASFSSQYDANTWTGEVSASKLSFDGTDGSPTVTPVWNFSDLLEAQASGTGWDSKRRIVTANAAGTGGTPFRAGVALDMTALNPGYVIGDDSVNYLKYLRGDRTNEANSTVTGSTKAYRTRTKLLGDIVGSKARAVGPPAWPFLDATNPGYGAFKTAQASRGTTVYVGSNDGMLHAINGALETTAAAPVAGDFAGEEMFAYVPRALFNGPNGTPDLDGLASLGNKTFVHHYLVNATPSVYDLDLARTGGSSATGTWASVLIGGLGKGGKSYYAINVTNPKAMVVGGESGVASKVLWEYSNAASMGYTYGDALVVKTRRWGWVVVLTSGYDNTDGYGHFLILNPATGALLQDVQTPIKVNGLAHAEAFIIDATDGTADAVYAGDLDGNLWRLDLTPLTGSYAAPTKIAELKALDGTPQPVTSRPTVAIHPKSKKRFVMVGTGRLLENSDVASTQIQSFYSIVDGTNSQFNKSSSLPTGISFPITRDKLEANTDPLADISFDPGSQMGWVEDLGVDPGKPAEGGEPAIASTGIAYRVISDYSTLAGSVAFATTLPNGDACSPSGVGRVYGRDFSGGRSTIGRSIVGTFALTSFLDTKGIVTDLRYLSVKGKATLISGTDTGGLSKIAIEPPGNLYVRRLNWRELQTVD